MRVSEDNKLIVFTSHGKSLMKMARLCFEGRELWDDKKELVETIEAYLKNPASALDIKKAKLVEFRDYFKATMDIEDVLCDDNVNLQAILPDFIKSIVGINGKEQILYLERNSLIPQMSTFKFDGLVEVKIPENGYPLKLPTQELNNVILLVINMEGVNSNDSLKLESTVDWSKYPNLVLLNADETHLSFLTSTSNKFFLKQKYGQVRIYEKKTLMEDQSTEWEELQAQWNTPMPRKMKFVGDPDWSHHHQNAYQSAINQLKMEFHDDDAEILFISAVEQYICDADATPKQPWIGVIHGISRNDDHFYVPDLEKLCTKARFRPWLNRCCGLFTLTSTQADYLKKNLPAQYKFPIDQIFYPTKLGINSQPLHYSAIEKVSNGIQTDIYLIGNFDRNFEHFFEAKFPQNMRKVVLECDSENFHLNVPSDVHVAKRADSDEYEKILQENVIFLSLKNGGAANTLIIECVTRSVPVVAPRFHSVMDYIGEDYPLLYDPSMTDFTDFITPESLHAARTYLENMDKSFLTQEKLIEDVKQSTVLAYMCPFSKEPSKFDVTITICSYKRTHNLKTILNSLLNGQSFQGSYEIIVWNNNYARKKTVEKIISDFSDSLQFSKNKRVEVISSSRNHYCSIRFAMASIMHSDKLLICDDDIIPGKDFIQFFYNNHKKHPTDVLCLRGNYFLPHEMPKKNPHTIWTDYEAFRFAEDHQEECFVHYVHSDACLIPRAALREVASTEPPDNDFMLVDDYWMSYVLSAKFNRSLRKLKVAENVVDRTSDSDTVGVAMYTRKDVANARTRMYLHHMAQGWPNLDEEKSIPYNDAEIKKRKVESWQKQRFGFNVNTEMNADEVRMIAEMGVNLVRVGIVGAGRDEGFEFAGLATDPKTTLDEMEGLVKLLKEYGIDVVIVLDGRVANEKNWQLIAETLCSYENVVGYDLFNEPHTAQNGTQHWYEIRKKDVEMDSEEFTILFKKLIKAIRKKDNVTPIIIETLFWANISTLSHLNIEEFKLIDDNILASIHFYLPQNFTWRPRNRGRYEFPGRVPIYEKPKFSETILWTPELIEQEFERVHQWSLKTGVRVFIGEFGVSRDVKGANNYLEAVGQACKKYNLSAAIYALRDPDWETMDYELGTDPNNYQIRQTGDENILFKAIRQLINQQ